LGPPSLSCPAKRSHFLSAAYFSAYSCGTRVRSAGVRTRVLRLKYSSREKKWA
jgi:hypothetical protein